MASGFDFDELLKLVHDRGCRLSHTHTDTQTHTHKLTRSLDRLSGVHLLTYPLLNPRIIRIIILHNYVAVCVGRIPLNPLQPCKADHSDVRHVLSIVSVCLSLSLCVCSDPMGEEHHIR